MPSKEYDFLMKQDLSAYEGQWVAVVDKIIIAARTLKEAVATAEKRFPQKQPLLMKVPQKQQYVL